MKLFRDLYHVRPRGILHVGAHEAEEYHEYEEYFLEGVAKCIWVEAQPDKAAELSARLRDKSNHKIIQALAWSDDVMLDMNITSKKASSSVFALGFHAEFYKNIFVVEKLRIKGERLDSILAKEDFFDFVVLDVQGAELEVLKGLGSLITSVKWIFTEISKRELFVGGAKFEEIEDFLYLAGFRRRFVEWDRNAGWGDALYIREEFWQDSLDLTIRRRMRWLYRRVYGRIPQPLFPYLVRVKRIAKTWIFK